MSVVEKICDCVAIIDKGVVAEVGSVEQIFTAPKTEAAKHLVIPQGESNQINPFDPTDDKDRLVRIVFDGTASSEPFIANLVEDTGKKVNILSANTKSVGGKGYGQMIVELPEEKEDQEIVLDYFRKSGLSVVEVSEHD